MATLKERIADIGKTGTIQIQAPKGLSIQVEIIDFKVSYGQERWLVRPLFGFGDGECWVESISIPD